jgi:hypothetical protein
MTAIWISATDLEAVVDAARLIELADDDADSEADDSVLERAMDDAEARATGALSARYTMPAAGAAPAELIELCARLAVWHLWKRRHAFEAERLPILFEGLDTQLQDLRTGRRTIQGLTARALYAQGTVTGPVDATTGEAASMTEDY